MELEAVERRRLAMRPRALSLQAGPGVPRGGDDDDDDDDSIWATTMPWTKDRQ